MSSTIISVAHLSKKYILKHQKQDSYVALRDVLSAKAKSIFRKKNSELSRSREEFLALNDVSFEIKRGERVGIIGRNGAGKSTLLKVLSRIVSPSAGEVVIEGRVASLLEVGTGFHPELTGRENIFLNGSILGMSRNEIIRKFDEIVAFSEVEKFLDTPVKRYSSGMYVRLAFAVAAHLEPEILVVDEVLAVGDAEFQKKCLGKMKDIAGSGRTVLFVSHNMAAIQNLCDKAIWLKNGSLEMMGESSQVITEYLRKSQTEATIDLDSRKDRSGNGKIRFSSVTVLDENRDPQFALQTGKTGIINIKFHHSSTVNNLHISVGIDDEIGQRIAHLSNNVTEQVFQNVNEGFDEIDIVIPKVPLKAGRYSYTLYSTVNDEISDYIVEAGVFEVEAGDFFGTGKLPPDGQGSIFIDHHFKLQKK